MIGKRMLSAAVLAGFLLGSFKGYVALWEDGDPEPKQIYPLKVSNLPEADQAALDQGIRAASTGELNRLLEDFLS